MEGWVCVKFESLIYQYYLRTGADGWWWNERDYGKSCWWQSMMWRMVKLRVELSERLFGGSGDI
jgi:hypothetical protein